MKFNCIKKYSFIGTSYYEIRRVSDDKLYSVTDSPFEAMKKLMRSSFVLCFKE